jgi:predicted protein tyrosine phosphatase
MKIEILNHRELVQRAFQRPLPNLIFISNPVYPYEAERSEEAVKMAANKLLLFFDDVESTHSANHPQKQHVQDALQFASRKSEIVVSCAAGRSRSAAIALTIAIREHGVDNAFRLLDRARHSPNNLIIRHAQEILMLPQLSEKIALWKVGI